MAFGDSDLGVFFGDFGVPVVYNGNTAQGVLDTYTDVFSHGDGPGGFESNTIVLRFPYNAFPATPKPLDSIQVNGIAYTVKELPQQRDAQVTELYLKLA